MLSNENLTRRHIFPFSKSSFAPVTNQWPGLSCGPLHNCEVSTNFKSFCVRTGTGGPVGNTLESTITTGFFSFSWLPEFGALIAEKKPDFWENSDELCAQLDWTMKACETLENKSRRWRMLFDSCFCTWSWAPVTMKETSFLVAHLGSYLTGAVHMWEKYFPPMASKYWWLSSVTSDPRHSCVSVSILLSSMVGVIERCWRWTASLR